MGMEIVTCGKCGKIFDYEKYYGICPKCSRYYSKTSYNENDAYMRNILGSANERDCSYHGSATNQGVGHSSTSFPYTPVNQPGVPMPQPQNRINSNVSSEQAARNMKAIEAQERSKKIVKSVAIFYALSILIGIIASFLSSIN